MTTSTEPAPPSSVAPALVRHALRLSIGLILPALLYGLWTHAVRARWLPEQILPAPALVWESAVALWDSGELAMHLAVSARRVAWSLLLGGAAGLALGVSMGLSRSARAYLLPSFHVVSQFPVLGWVPLLIIVAGIDEALKVSAISIAVAVPVATQALRGIEQIPRSLFEVCRVHRLTPWQVCLRLVLPAAAPSLFNGLRQAVMQAWLTLVFVELLASSEGIGYLMVWGRQLAQLDLVVLGMAVIGLVGVLLDLLLRAVESRLAHWRRHAF